LRDSNCKFIDEEIIRLRILNVNLLNKYEVIIMKFQQGNFEGEE
jgi:hypothetical protein